MRIIGVIPARYGSTRLPAKPLKDILGKPMVQWVYEGALKSKLLNEVVVATDDERIKDTVEKFGGKVKMTSPNCQSGSDRIAEAVKKEKFDIVVNIQGDEPLMAGTVIDKAITALIKKPEAVVGTVCSKIINEDDYDNPNSVKVIFDRNGYSLYFSRSRIPSAGEGYKHIGIYAFKYEFLMKFIKMKRSRLEIDEKLEQLRILENGYKIGIEITDKTLISVDTIEDVRKVEKFLKGK